MTRRAADSVTTANLPEGFDLYGAYVDGRYKNFAQTSARFPGRTFGIAAFSTTNDGIVGDCENGDMTPQTAVTWVVMRRKAGVDPTIYCSEAAWAAVQVAFNTARVPQPHYWIAAYPGNGDQLYAGAVAHQWIDRGPYDESIVADYWPGVDPAPIPPAPVPPPTTYPGDNLIKTPVTVTIANGEGWNPSPVPAGQVVNAVFADENPEIVRRYDKLPAFVGVAEQASKDAPNGSINWDGPDGTFGAVVWSVA